ncbi:LuxR C-terminal-related transcriptional regulator [Promicromonospora sp. NPDC050249]|uniref:LuxR C-terminal-related transcriptional regulator n=1 Tax=Promicromonospora sp. NPDC050249 TaxID=3154743 RepID=UPI0033FE382F
MPPVGAFRRPTVEKALQRAMRPDTGGLVLLRGPSGTGRRTAVALWSRRLARDRTVVWVDVAPSDALDGDALASAIRTKLSHLIGEDPAAPLAENTSVGATATQGVAAALDAHGVVLVIDRLGPASAAALTHLDRMARLLRKAHVVALTALPVPHAAPTFNSWTNALGDTWDVTMAADRAPVTNVELGMRDLAVRPDEAHATASALGTPLSRSQADLLCTATAGWPAVLYPALEELRRASAMGDPITNDLVSTVAAAHRAAFLRGMVPEETVDVLVEASIAPTFSRRELSETGLLAVIPDGHRLLDRLVEVGLVLDDPAAPDDVLAVEPYARRAILDYARGRDRGELSRRAAKVALRREQAYDVRGALLVALESGDAGLVRDLLHSMWTGVLDGHDATLHEALWSAAASVPAAHVPTELRALLAMTRRTPGQPGAHEPSTDQLSGPPLSDGPDGPLLTFARIAQLRRAGRTDDALRLARRPLGTAGRGSDVARVLVGLQAALTAAEAGLLDEALRYAKGAHQGALSSGALPLGGAAAELVALVHALDSGVRPAADWSREAHALPEPPTWWRHAVGDPTTLTSALTRLERLDDDLPDRLLTAAQDTASTDLWFAGLHVEATLAALRHQEEPAVARLRETLAQRGRTPHDTYPSAERRQVPPLLALDLGRLYLALGRGTNALVIADAVITRAPAAALLEGRLRLARGQARDALLAVTSVGYQDSTAGTRLQAHLIAAEALGADAGQGVDEGARADVRRELAHAAALAQRVGGALPYWWASSDVLRLVARDAPEPVREQIAQVLRRRGEPTPVEFVVVPDRQLVVLHHLADGLTSTEIAKVSFVSHNTIKTQIREIYRRLGVHDRSMALQRARELGLLDPIVRARLDLPSRP